MEKNKLDRLSIEIILLNLNDKDLKTIILDLLISGKLSYTDLSKEYVNYLERNNNIAKEKFSEACACILNSAFDEKFLATSEKFDKDSYTTTQRCLHILDGSPFKIDNLKEKYKYNKEFVKNYLKGLYQYIL